MKLAQQIKRLRTSLGLSQENFAERIGVERNTISLWEREKQTPSKKHLEDVEKAFSLPQGYFVVEQPVAISTNVPDENSTHPSATLFKKIAVSISAIVVLVVTCVLIALWGQGIFWSLETYLGTTNAFKTVATACAAIFFIVFSAVGLSYCIFRLFISISKTKHK